MAPSSKGLDFLINHVVLPPKLPQEEDDEDDRQEGEFLLLQMVRKSAETLVHHLEEDTKEVWDPVLRLLRNMENLSQNNAGWEDRLTQVLLNLQISDAVSFHVKAQNAGLLIFRPDEDHVFVHAFEASARCESVMKTNERLIWDFPGRSVAVDSNLLQNGRFVQDLVTMAWKMCREGVNLSMPTSRKAGQYHKEERDTVHPGLVTEGLMSMLESLGAPCKSPSIRKFIRDDVNWNNCRLPWRRSPLWLVIRVSIQLLLKHQLPGDTSRLQYKNLMALFMANVCQLALQRQVATDIQMIVTTKTACRLSKLGKEAINHVQVAVQTAVQNARNYLDIWWEERRRLDTTTIPKLSNNAAKSDCNLTLAASGEYLRKALTETEEHSTTRQNTLSNRDNLDFTENGLPNLELFMGDFQQIYSLTEFEQWILEKLRAWLEKSKRNEKDCVSLREVSHTYMDIALGQYKGNSRALSIMLLVILEIWTVLDLICLELYPLLRDYPPDIPSQIGEPLLLPHHCQLQSLQRIENHLLKRHKEANMGHAKILNSIVSDSFAVRFFNQSEKHKSLKYDIEREAATTRELKELEWRRTSDEYASLEREASSLSHLKSTDNYFYCASNCRKCYCEGHARRLHIYVDEWPLPTNLTDLKAAIFELACPPGFSAWRDLTWMIVQDLGRLRCEQISEENVQHCQKLLNYNRLSRYAVSCDQRVSFGSTVKSFLRSHYNMKHFPVELREVCVNNAFQWHLLDNEKLCWTRNQHDLPSFSRHCFSPLPVGPYSSLQDFVDESSFDHNDIMARQDQCDSKLSSHEFVAFGSVRAGERIQWLNILRELGSADLTINTEEVYILFRQAALQANTRLGDDVLREAHAPLNHPKFNQVLLDLLEKQLGSIKSNWNEQARLATITMLGLRILSLAPDSEITIRVVQLLRQVRHTSLIWCSKISSRLPECSSDQESQRLRQTILISALACRMTFNCEASQVHLVLEHDDDVADFVQSSIHLFDNTPIILSDLPLDTQHSLVVGSKIACIIEEHLQFLAARSSTGINEGVQRACDLAGFVRNWQVMEDHKGWIACEVKTGERTPPQVVNYDLLTGEVLLDGSRIGRLPSEFTNAPVYSRVFGSRILNVTRSCFPCMQYKTLSKIGNYEIHLGMRGNELLLQAITGTQRLRHVPHDVLDRDLPKSLTEDYIHWMDLDTGTILFCPLHSPWEATPGLTLRFVSDGASCMHIGRKQLIDQRSQIGNSIIKVLEALEPPSRIVVTVEQNKVEAEIPRFRLKFFINPDGCLESKELGAVVDRSQDIGCLFKLRSKLVLQSTCQHGSLPDKSVIIPYGRVHMEGCSDTSYVEIHTNEEKKLRLMHYRLDETLSRLRTRTGRDEKLYLAYLHAVTSTVLPDQLTKQTGTEEALRILSEQSLRVSSPVTGETLYLLNRIAALTPAREYYPEHLESMQTVKWNSHLSQLAQHERFNTLAKDIMQHASQFAAFYGAPNTSRDFKSRGNEHLLAKATNRNASVRGPVTYTRQKRDMIYNARDADAGSTRARIVYETASLTRIWPNRIDVVPDLVEKVRKWKKVQDYGHKCDPWGTPCNDLLQLHLGQNWGSLHQLCHDCNYEKDLYKLMFLFCMIVYAQPDSVQLVHTLLGMASSQCLKNDFPDESSYDLSAGEGPSRSTIWDAIDSCCQDCPRRSNEDYDDWMKRLSSHRTEKCKQIKKVLDHVLSQWPCDSPSIYSLSGIDIVDTYRATTACAELYTVWNKNRKFILYVEKVQSFLEKVRLDHIDTPQRTSLNHTVLDCGQRIVKIAPSLNDLLRERNPPKLPNLPVPLQVTRACRSGKTLQTGNELRKMLDDMRSCNDATRQNYAHDLSLSLDIFDKTDIAEMPESFTVTSQQLLDCKASILSYTQAALSAVTKALVPETAVEGVLAHAGLWPRTNWKHTLLLLGQAISMLQRSMRLLRFYYSDDVVAFSKDAEDPGHLSWSPQEFPDWLLLELENNLTIRDTQVIVARQMIRPDSASNSVLQLNMGEGKSSVIVPMVVTALADQVQLARLIVLKPLLRQTENLLSQRLGGLLDRRIYHIPFSRETRVDKSQITVLQRIYEQCIQERGILIALPEHMMSFRLMGRERLLTQPDLGIPTIQLDTWLEKHSRDVLDESDEILDPRFQLVYSIGTQALMDGQPDRWTLVQKVLSLFSLQAQLHHSKGGDDLEIEFRGRSFPSIAFLDPSIGNTLIDMLVQEIGRGNLLGVSLSHCSREGRRNILEFIKSRSIPPEIFAGVDKEFRDTELWSKLHLLRGLIAHETLLFAFQRKRWLVNYGLDPSRCMMAVPYRAKGVPSLSAEFGHPDVAIVLTCLSYYYGGLTPQQLDCVFSLLMKESDPSTEYAKWVQDCPELHIRSINGVNLEDSDTRKHIFFHMKYSKSAIDFYLSTVVFPREGTEFPRKLSSSAWDLPSQGFGNITTGFSGTNDNKFLFPMSIRQHDLEALSHTNAMVANLLLQHENRRYIEAVDSEGKKLEVKGLLELISRQKSSVQVLIDVGAQVLDSLNSEVAVEWLSRSPQARAAVYFDNADELMVVDREGYTERLSSSPFHQHLDSCLIYLDEVHTRGIDLSMPTSARAAVTLGPGTTKDRLAQACMRMRKLGCHQSLLFLAPPEVHQDILRVTGKTQHDTLTSVDVVQWSFVQTCHATDGLKPLWIMQGLEHARRKRLCSQYLADQHENLGDYSQRSAFCSNLEESEAKLLVDMYGVEAQESVFRPCLTDDKARQDQTVQSLLSEWEIFKESKHEDWALREEQEREIAHEVEQERENQKPPPSKALRHELHPEVHYFVRNGLPAVSISQDLLVTTDFARTVENLVQAKWDDFTRPVRWVLSSTSTGCLLIISPFEANRLLPELWSSTHVSLHMYSPKISKSMEKFSDLDFFNVTGIKKPWISSSLLNFYDPARTNKPWSPSPLLTTQLELFSGCLFFETYSSYKKACHFLGILTADQDGSDVYIHGDGFANVSAREKLNWPLCSPFEKTPLPFFKALVGIRRKGYLYSGTHFGHLVSGHLLTEESFY
ncbi:uncharacterized protein K452DRAFT_237232 [Aplosporella prunicola CBS 121167]|uniref:ubiquitinyl hydrolase 1 n=1 Tax=Aplosporella prunicola CBS 121167 TaxID=1176127 RepID=A0A6A6AXF8_9PEZI|nr:uncharacterized protein K452DRAFT_237232 [Aplosporella prunicola CBS 121167]KAF2136619.1 hypothetical protein K452DRAFT_237232 [Aplosporella prunicola CBS 121167]